MKKHAYLIMAHNNFEQLKIELKLLDDPRNDIYIHIDKKAKQVNKNDIVKNIEYSEIYFIQPISVQWAGYSVTKCEFLLLKEAVKQKYEYYHLLSGADLPLKSQDEIHHFFKKNEGMEFLAFDHSEVEKSIEDRLRYYYFFQNIYGRNRKNPIYILLYCLDKALLYIQKRLHINRIKNNNTILQKGAEWFSITHGLAELVVSKEQWVKKTFSHTFGSDEIFLQTIVRNSKYKNRIFMNGLRNEKLSPCMRKIDWGRGKPYIWKSDDLDELLNSKALYARKFDENIDKNIIEKIYEKCIVINNRI